MLEGNFFTVGSVDKEAASVSMVIMLNAGHAIFAGHFPGQPVVPGACLLQMVKEIMQDLVQEELQLVNAHHLKFIALIDPSKNDVIQATFTHTLTGNKQLAVSAVFLYDATVCFKFSGIFSIL